MKSYWTAPFVVPEAEAAAHQIALEIDPTDKCARALATMNRLKVTHPGWSWEYIRCIADRAKYLSPSLQTQERLSNLYP